MPTIRRQVVDGPSREDLIVDGLRLGTRVHIDVALPDPIPTVGQSPTEKQLVELALATMPSFSGFVTGIEGPLDQERTRWNVTMRLEESNIMARVLVKLTAFSYNTKNRRNSGVLEVTWEMTDSS
jgi:hypothetical protein